jgi:hypothetical protein
MSTACPAWLSSKPGIASSRTIGTVPHARTHTILDMDMPVKKCILIKDTCILSRHNHFGSQRKCILCILRFQKACILSCHDHFGCDKVLPIFSGCVSLLKYCRAIVNVDSGSASRLHTLSLGRTSRPEGHCTVAILPQAP